MSASGLGRRYALALLQLADDEGKLDVVLEGLRRIGSAWSESDTFRQLARNPSVPRPAVEAAVHEIGEKLQLDRLVMNTLGVLAHRGRFSHLPEVIEAFETLAESRSGVVRAEVTSAKPMSEAYYGELQQKLEKLTGTRVVLVKKQDPSIIAGVITRVGDRVFDGSVRNRLNELQEDLLAVGP